MNWRNLFHFSRQTPQKRSAALTPDLQQEIRLSFDEASRDEEHFPTEIDPRIYHVRLILQYFGNLEGRRILDAGCGKGRFARVLLQQYPKANLCGLDISAEMLKFAPAEMDTTVGTLCSLPFANNSFDFAYATESLEHAVDIERAVGELCRVLKPGGRLVIIDKNAEHFGKLKTSPWEKWFHRDELDALLRQHCRTVSSRFISYWEDVEPDGMFIAWLAEK